VDRAFVSDMTNVMNNIGEYLGYILIIIFGLGWMDILWIFGVENSQQYTWWNLVYQLGNI
jgi:hypothetical protein